MRRPGSFQQVPVSGRLLLPVLLLVAAASIPAREAAAAEPGPALFGARWHVTGIGDLAGMPLVLLLFLAYLFAITPVFNSVTRTLEAEADLFGLNASGQADGAAEVALKLGEYRKLAPGPLEEIIFYDHPSGRSRIEMAMRYKAENPGPN